MLRRFVTYCFLFLTPVVLCCLGIELAVRAIPTSQSQIAANMASSGADTEILVLGASQNQAAFYPEYIDQPTLNMASGHQDYRTDLKILKQLSPRLPDLHTVVIPMTFAHLRTAPNPTEYWKNAGYLYYYDINAFERPTYFKDKILWLSNPGFYLDLAVDYYIKGKRFTMDASGYQNTDAVSAFAKAKFDPDELAVIPLSMGQGYEKKYVRENQKALGSLLRFCQEKGYRVVVALTPITEKHARQRPAALVAERDSLLASLQKKYTLFIFDQETSPAYELTAFNNHNHLNSRGAIRYSKSFNAFLKTLD